MVNENDIHPLDVPYSTAGAVDDGAPSLNRKRAVEMTHSIEVAVNEQQAIEDVQCKIEKAEALEEQKALNEQETHEALEALAKAKKREETNAKRAATRKANKEKKA